MNRRLLLEIYLPGLEGSDYEITSEATDDYNCIAWALGETDRFWNPIGVYPDYWPEGLPRDVRLSSVVLMFQQQGFESVGDARVEAGFEKIALFGDQERFIHVARQLASGRWTSKLGNDCDIEHDLEDLVRRRSPSASYRYGQIVGYMRRPRRSSEPNP